MPISHRRLTCDLPQWRGLNLTVQVCRETECGSANLLSYGRPFIRPRSLRRFGQAVIIVNNTGIVAQNNTDAGGDVLEFDGDYFLPGSTLVYFGSPNVPDAFPCAVGFVTTSYIRCTTAASVGLLIPFGNAGVLAYLFE
jgi:hypothetical protein